MSYEYQDPVSKLLHYRDLLHLKEWPDYQELGLTREHIPDLIRMATHVEIHQTDPDSREWWAPIHAWRALGQLKAEEAIQPLMSLFHEQEQLDWALDDLPVVYGMIGPKAIPELARYLADDSHGVWPRAAAMRSLQEIAQQHAETREECVAILTRQLARTVENDPEVNGALVNYLLDLHAVESLDVIRHAYAEDAVDVFGPGTLAEVERELLPATAPLAGPKQKIGRNDPCPCGSGKKYKKCCLGKERAA